MKSILEDTAWAGIELESSELSRYARHITIPDVGLDGQKKVENSQRPLHRRGRPRLASQLCTLLQPGLER